MKSFKQHLQEQNLTFYHGSDHDFTEFNLKKSKRAKSIFLTTEYNNALSYGKIIYEVRPKSSNMFDYRKSNDMNKLENKIDDILKKEEQKDYRKRKSLYPFTKSVVIEGIKMGKWNFLEQDLILKALKALKYDGFYAVEGNDTNYGYFDPKNLTIIDKLT